MLFRSLSLYPDELRDHKSVMPEFIMECQPAKATFFAAFFGPSLYLISVRNFPFIDKLNARAHKSAEDVARWGDATFAKSLALENKPMSDMNQDSAEISAQTPAVNFDSFGLPELMLATLAREGLVSPTPIQEMSIPLLLEGRDLIGLAQTGTGKTASFLLPLMTHLGYSAAVRAGQPPKALILAPTRELANQIEQNVSKLSRSEEHTSELQSH